MPQIDFFTSHSVLGIVTESQSSEAIDTRQYYFVYDTVNFTPANDFP